MIAAPLTLFAALSFFDLRAAAVLALCVPLIPMSIMMIMRIAKKIFSKYWGDYVNMGERFLDNLQGLTTLKVYDRDADHHERMNEDAQKFRRVTMRVLQMQLHSISLMDIMAFGCAVAGSAVAIHGFAHGRVSLMAAFAVIMLAGEFFIPLRQLGSFFHVAMNGITASKKMFAFLDDEGDEPKDAKPFPGRADIRFRNTRFSYVGDEEVLRGVSFTLPAKSFVAFAGKSGCGKSTIAAIIAGKLKADGVFFGDTAGRDIPKSAFHQKVITVSSNSYIFAGTVRKNLLMACGAASDAEMERALRTVRLLDELDSLDHEVMERGTNLSGGQRQRLALARALLCDADVYVFDEATSGVDVESEELIMSVIAGMKGEKTVVLISHRLYNMKDTDMIYVLEDGRVTEQGRHDKLAGGQGLYAAMFREQEGTAGATDEMR